MTKPSYYYSKLPKNLRLKKKNLESEINRHNYGPMKKRTMEKVAQTGGSLKYKREIDQASEEKEHIYVCLYMYMFCVYYIVIRNRIVIMLD